MRVRILSQGYASFFFSNRGLLSASVRRWKEGPASTHVVSRRNGHYNGDRNCRAQGPEGAQAEGPAAATKLFQKFAGYYVRACGAQISALYAALGRLSAKTLKRAKSVLGALGGPSRQLVKKRGTSGGRR
jgi:hypothetical protein